MAGAIVDRAPSPQADKENDKTQPKNGKMLQKADSLLVQKPLTVSRGVRACVGGD